MSDLSVLSLISDLSVLSVLCPDYPVCLVCPVCPGCPVCPDDHDDHDYHDDDDHLDHDELTTIKFVRKLEVVHKEVGGCTQGSWRLSDQMCIAASIAQIDNHQSLTHSLSPSHI